jgi:hypothetical protein
MARGMGTVRGIGVGVCAAVLLTFNAATALACDTGSWLALDGNADSGAVVTVRGGGLEPGPTSLVWERSGGEVLGETSVAADGRLELDVEIPATAAGRHTIIAVPAAAVDSPTDLHAWTDVVVPGAAVEPRPAPVPTGQAAAGSSLPGQVALGLAALLIAVLGFAVRRRRGPTLPAAQGDGPVDPLDAELQRILADPDDEPSPATGATGPPTRR